MWGTKTIVISIADTVYSYYAFLAATVFSWKRQKIIFRNSLFVTSTWSLNVRQIKQIPDIWIKNVQKESVKEKIKGLSSFSPFLFFFFFWAPLPGFRHYHRNLKSTIKVSLLQRPRRDPIHSCFFVPKYELNDLVLKLTPNKFIHRNIETCISSHREHPSIYSFLLKSAETQTWNSVES